KCQPLHIDIHLSCFWQACGPPGEERVSEDTSRSGRGFPCTPFLIFLVGLRPTWGGGVSEGTSRSGRGFPCTPFLITSGLNGRKLCIGIEDIPRNNDV